MRYNELIENTEPSDQELFGDKKNLDFVDFKSIKLGGIHHNDYPDFVDAYVDDAVWKNGIPLTDDELEWLTDELASSGELNSMAHDSLYETQDGEVSDSELFATPMRLRNDLPYEEQLARQLPQDIPQGLEGEHAILDAAFAIVKREMGAKRARGMFRNEDFESDLVSTYRWLQNNQGLAENFDDEDDMFSDKELFGGRSTFRTVQKLLRDPANLIEMRFMKGQYAINKCIGAQEVDGQPYLFGRSLKDPRSKFRLSWPWSENMDLSTRVVHLGPNHFAIVLKSTTLRRNNKYQGMPFVAEDDDSELFGVPLKSRLEKIATECSQFYYDMMHDATDPGDRESLEDAHIDLSRAAKAFRVGVEQGLRIIFAMHSDYAYGEFTENAQEAGIDIDAVAEEYGINGPLPGELDENTEPTDQDLFGEAGIRERLAKRFAAAYSAIIDEADDWGFEAMMTHAKTYSKLFDKWDDGEHDPNEEIPRRESIKVLTKVVAELEKIQQNIYDYLDENAEPNDDELFGVRKMWYVNIMGNYNTGRYSDYGARRYIVPGATAEDAIKWLKRNEDWVYMYMDTQKSMNGKRIVRRPARTNVFLDNSSVFGEAPEGTNSAIENFIRKHRAV